MHRYVIICFYWKSLGFDYLVSRVVVDAINIIDPESWFTGVKRSNRGSHIGRCKGPRCVFFVKENGKFIKMGMTVKVSCNRILVAVDDIVEISAPHRKAVALARRDVSHHMNFNAFILTFLQLVCEPF